nr:MAG TPA: hypothetical protein [Caudoviricetes sp.]
MTELKIRKPQKLHLQVRILLPPLRDKMVIGR